MKHYWGLYGIMLGAIVILFSTQIMISNNTHSTKKITLASSAFIQHGTIPNTNVYAECGGSNRSPQLRWSSVPKNTQSLALIVDDPDAPSAKNPRENPWVHWVVFDLPPTINILEENVSIEALGGKEGITDFEKISYGGPCPPVGSGPHRYFFKLYALDIPTLGLESGATKADVLRKIDGHVLATGELMGTFEIK